MPSARDIMMDAERGAADRLFRQDCADLFLTSDDNTSANRAALSRQLDAIRDNGFIRTIAPSSLENANPNDPAFTTGSKGLIYIVSGGAFFTGKIDGKAMGGFASDMNLTSFQQAVILHELFHWMGIVGPDTNESSITLLNGDKVTGSQGVSEKIKEKCFR